MNFEETVNLFHKTTAMLMSGLVSACTIATTLASNTIWPAAQVDLPFHAGVKGSVVETQLHASTTKNYTFYLDLHFREGDQQDRERVRKLAGTGAYDRSGPGARQIDTGLRIPVHLSVGRVGAVTQWSILDADFASHDLEGFTAGYYSKIIAGARLEPGDYRVRLEALQNIPELSDIPVSFNIHVRPF